MTRRSITAALVAALFATGIAVTVAAQGPGPGGRGRGPGGPGGPGGIPGLQAVGLTDAQKEQVRTIHEANREQAQQLGQRIGAAQKALDEAAAGNASEGDIRAKASDLANAIADGAIHRAKVNAEILNLLTAEQKQKLDEFRTTMQQRRGAVQDRMQNRMQKRQQLRGL